jgi:predicted RecB family nuclease
MPHPAQSNVMTELHGGRDSWLFTERDMRNRYVHVRCDSCKFVSKCLHQLCISML